MEEYPNFRRSSFFTPFQRLHHAGKLKRFLPSGVQLTHHFARELSIHFIHGLGFDFFTQEQGFAQDLPKTSWHSHLVKTWASLWALDKILHRLKNFEPRPCTYYINFRFGNLSQKGRISPVNNRNHTCISRSPRDTAAELAKKKREISEHCEILFPLALAF